MKIDCQTYKQRTKRITKEKTGSSLINFPEMFTLLMPCIIQINNVFIIELIWYTFRFFPWFLDAIQNRFKSHSTAIILAKTSPQSGSYEKELGWEEYLSFL